MMRRVSRKNGEAMKRSASEGKYVIETCNALGA